MKRLSIIKNKIEKRKYIADEAFDFLVQNSKEFESIDVAFVLGINPKKSDQVVKGVVENVPSGLGKKITVAVFSENITEDVRKIADFVGFEDLYENIKSGAVDADVYIATKDAMMQLAKKGIGKLLKGKMPNAKLGTVVENDNDLEKVIKMQKFGQINFRSNEKVVHASIGRATFTKDQLNANYQELLKKIISVKPNPVKPHEYIKRIYTSSTMGPSIEIKFEGKI